MITALSRQHTLSELRHLQPDLVNAGDQHAQVVVGRTGSVVQRHLDGGDDVGANAGHGVELHPFALGRFLAPFLVVPAHETAGGETSRVDGKVTLYALEGQRGQLHAGLSLWLALLVVGVIAIGVGLFIIIKGEPQTAEQPLGSFLVKGKKSELSTPDAGPEYQKGSSVWPQKWWRPGRPEVIHVEQFKPLEAPLDVADLGRLLYQGKSLNVKYQTGPPGEDEVRTWVIRGWRLDVERALTQHPTCLSQFKSALPPTWISDPSDLDLLRAQLDVLQRILENQVYPS